MKLLELVIACKYIMCSQMRGRAEKLRMDWCTIRRCYPRQKIPSAAHLFQPHWTRYGHDKNTVSLWTRLQKCHQNKVRYLTAEELIQMLLVGTNWNISVEAQSSATVTIHRASRLSVTHVLITHSSDHLQTHSTRRWTSHLCT